MGQHLSQETKEKIWKGAYVSIFSLLIDEAEREEAKKNKEWTHPREWSNIILKYRVEENLANWVHGFTIHMAIMLERFPAVGSEMACYQNRITAAHATYGGNGWKEYNKEFRRAKAQDPSLGWSQTDMFIHLKHLGQGPSDNLPGQAQDNVRFQPFHAGPSGNAGGTSGKAGGTGKKGVCFDFSGQTCNRAACTCRFKHSCGFCGNTSHPESKCFKTSREKGVKKQE